MSRISLEQHLTALLIAIILAFPVKSLGDDMPWWLVIVSFIIYFAAGEFIFFMRERNRNDSEATASTEVKSRQDRTILLWSAVAATVLVVTMILFKLV